MLAVEYMLVQI